MFIMFIFKCLRDLEVAISKCRQTQMTAAQGRGQHDGVGSCTPTGGTETMQRALKRILHGIVFGI